jgi:two-component system cell cycle sensor histidine kinase/response regulator CckA
MSAGSIMKQDDLLKLRETVNRLQEENLNLRSALETNDCGRAMLQQSEEFSRLLSVSKRIVSELDLAKVFDLVADNAREIVKAELAIVPMLNEERDRYTYLAASGADADSVRGTSFKANIGMCGWVLQHEQSLLFGETSTHWMNEKTPWEEGQQSAVLVPLFGRKGIIGGLSALGKQGGGPFTQHDLELLTMFANQVSIAIDNAQLFQQVTREIEERKRTEEAVRKSEEKYRQLFNSIRDALLITDNERSIIDCNPAFTALFGYSLNEIAGKKTSVIMARHEQFVALGESVKIQTADKLLIFQADYRKKNGEIFPGEVAVSFFSDISGNRTGYIGLIKDITHRKQAEAEKRALEDERQKSQKLEAIGTLAGGIAHDFNNLLQGVFGYISLAKLKSDDREKSLAALEEAEKALHMSVKLTNQLLTFSKGGKPLTKTIDLLPVIKNAAKFALSGSRTDYRVVVDDDLWQVDADEGQISQVIHNIVLNADQAMPEGGWVEIAARNIPAQAPDLPQRLQKGPAVEITIKDSGIGIPEPYLAKIFDPYFSTKEKGSGLGLATSYSIMKNHKGSIEVTSEMGKGTTFSLYLPATMARRAEVQNKPATAATAGRIWRVLVMDDEEIVRDIALALITELGHRAELAVHGREAIEKYLAAKCSGDPFDAVILDLTIRGGMGGAETLQRLKEIDPGVKTVVSSGYSDDSLIAGYQEQGFKAVLRKPYDVDELQEVLNRLLNT